MSDGPRRGPYAIAKDLAIAAKNAAAELRLGFAEGEWEGEVTDAGRAAPHSCTNIAKIVAE